ncbi:class I SAM-dependent methyltransferase [Massilia pinisoli]|uniref:Class I SAM-dependent methyltransferase n=1 Tax=Massilia pinisoli TaxID=1772194 RepID=A0ABT1ZUT9_9BURK|nr:class I SAM-dependent methyltransferase [Massilia pinisoli]MCS0583725.1 class I SAM-dependent methyltransferase [Massilia pinisoli]
MNRNNDPVARYYASSTQAADAALSRAERANDLARVRERLAQLVRGQTVLELACGTGYWTEVIAATADKVLATDILDTMLARAQTRRFPEGKVAFRRVDGLDLPDDLGTFSCVFIGFWWSHLKRDEQDALLAQLRARLGQGVVLILLDDAYVEGSSTTVARTDAQGNTYEIVAAPDGERFELPKSYPADSALRKRLADGVREIRIERLTYYWMLTCRLK